MSGRKGAGFLVVTAAFAVLLLAVGAWEWAVAGAVHQLLLGAVLLTLTALARFFRRRSPPA